MIPIVFSTDHNYVMPTGVTICSLLLSAGGETYDIYILMSPDVTAEDKDILTRQVDSLSPDSRISFIDMGTHFEGGYEIRDISTACYYRLLIPWLIPHVDKIIYADVDIIFRSSLRTLYDMDLGDSYVAGAYPCNPRVWEDMAKYINKIGADYKTYVNSGVLLINSRLQRQDALDKKYSELSRNKYLYQDQDIINIVCRGRVSRFDYRYNLIPSFFGSDGLLDDIVIHYAGDKPWKAFTYAWVQWWDVYRKSLFWNPGFYREVSARIISPKEQLKLFRRKSLQKMKQFLSKTPF